MLTETQKAFISWKKYQPRDNNPCCYLSHFDRVNGLLTSKQDVEICVRERKWREYVRLRDGIILQ